MSGVGLSAYTQAATNVSGLTSGTIANNAQAVASSPLDNTGNLDDWMDVTLQFQFSTAPTANTALNLYLIPEVDGSNYATYGTPPASMYLVGVLPVQAVTTAQVGVVRGVALGPCKFTALLYNNGTGQTVTLNGCTYRSYSVA